MHKIDIYDTTLRDGSQGEGVNFSLLDKVMIAERLDEIGVDFIEGGYPLSNEKDSEFFQRAAKINWQSAKICAFGMTRRRGIDVQDDPGMQALLASEAPIITIVGKTWDFHVTDVLGVTLEENLQMISDTVGYLRDQGRRVIYDAEHFFDGWKANPSYAPQTIQAAAAAGAESIVMCDTNGGSMPVEIAEHTRLAIAALGKFDSHVGIHCHNDCELGVANSLASVQAGAMQVQGTINGIGERCGNADLVSVIANLTVKLGDYQTLRGSDVSHLTELSRFVYETANMHLRTGQPFVGQSAFAHKGGMHVHAVAKASSTYEHIDPKVVGNERRILVSELSGRSNIVALTTKHEIQDDKQLMTAILERVVQMENQGYQFEVATASFDLLVKRCAGSFQPHYHLEKYHVNVERNSTGEGGNVLTEATIKVDVDGVSHHEVAEGDGPVNALDAALRKALLPKYPALEQMRLVDYKVRVVNEEAGTAARIRVIVESQDDEDTWGTIGVSENIIEASWMALNDAIEYKLYKDEHRATTANTATASNSRV